MEEKFSARSHEKNYCQNKKGGWKEKKKQKDLLKKVSRQRALPINEGTTGDLG